MPRGEEAEPRARFGLPPETPARRGLLAPGRAFIILAAAGLAAWLFAGGAPDRPSAEVSDDARAAGAPEVSPSPAQPAASEVPPTEAQALSLFRSLDLLRATAADRAVAPGVSVRDLERDVPPGGQTVALEVLSVENSRIRIRQVVDLSAWDVDLAAEDLSVGRAGRRLGVEWTLARLGDGWWLEAWTVVEDRAVVRDR